MNLSKKQPKFEAFLFENNTGELIDVKFDLRKLFTGDVVYINATQVAKQFGKESLVRQMYRGKDVAEYIVALESQKYRISDVSEKHIKTIKNKYIYGVKSGPNRGTWIHKDLAIMFAKKMSVSFSVWCDLKIQELITYGHAWVEARESVKRQFKKVGKLVDTKLKPAMTSKNDIQWAYKKEADLINIAVLGISATKFRRDNDIPKQDAVRDHLSKEQIELLDEAEGFDCALIHMGVFDYYERKARVTSFILESTEEMAVAA